jgi:tetratricopeptide (TPR) repeat protein
MRPTLSSRTRAGKTVPPARCKAAALGLALLLGAVGFAQSDPGPGDVERALASGHLQQAQQMIDRVLAAHPGSGQAAFMAAEVAAQRGNFSVAREQLQRAEELTPGLPFASAASVKRLRSQLAQAPSPPGKTSSGSADPTADDIYDALSSGKLELAQQLIDKVLAAHPENARAHYVAAEVAAERDEPAVARRELARAEQLSPGLTFTTPSSVAQLRAQLAGTAAAPAAPAAPAPAAPAAPAAPQ